MLGNFTYENPTRLHFGREAMGHLPEELARYGSKVLLVYGGGSIKTNGIYEQVINILRENGKEVIELGGIPANPTLEKLHEGIELVRKHDVDFMLAVGGGSVIDYTKGLSASAWCEENPWEKYYLRQEEPTCRIIPLGCILTMVGTGSEMNGGSVITNTAAKLKIGKDSAPDTDGCRILRCTLAPLRAIFFGYGRQYQRLHCRRPDALADTLFAPRHQESGRL